MTVRTPINLKPMFLPGCICGAQLVNLRFAKDLKAIDSNVLGTLLTAEMHFEAPNGGIVSQTSEFSRILGRANCISLF